MGKKKPSIPVRTSPTLEAIDLLQDPQVLHATLPEDSRPPRLVNEILEIRHQQGVREVWNAAVKLKAALHLGYCVDKCMREHKTLSAGFEESAMSMFENAYPLNKLREILHFLASFTKPGCMDAVKPPAAKVSLDVVEALFQLITKQIRQFFTTLMNYRVDSSVFNESEDLGWVRYFLAWDWRLVDTVSEHTEFAHVFPQKEFDRLWFEADSILSRLQSEPSRVVPAPSYPEGVRPIVLSAVTPEVTHLSEHLTPSWRDRLFVNADKRSIVLDGAVHPVSYEAGLWFQELWVASGLWVSFSTLQKTHQILKSKRSDRLQKALPPAVQKYVVHKAAAGSRIDVEQLA